MKTEFLINLAIFIFKQLLFLEFLNRFGSVASLTCCLVHSVMFDSYATPWTVARQVSLFMGFSWQNSWNECPFPASGGLSNPRIEPVSLVSLVLHLDSLTTGEAINDLQVCIKKLLTCGKFQKCSLLYINHLRLVIIS